MKRRYFAIGLVAAIALSSCGLGKPAIVGKWKCINPISIDTIEYLADGTALSTFEYTSKPPYMSDIDWDIKKGDKVKTVATWKILEGDRLQVITSDGKSGFVNFKVDGKTFQFDPPNGVKCDRL
jgi:hypothetical protein